MYCIYDVFSTSTDIKTLSAIQGEEQGGEGVEDAIEMPSLEAAASAASLQTSPTSPVSGLSMVSAVATQNFAGEAEPEQSDADKGESSDKPEPWNQVALESVERHRVSKCT